MALQLHRGQMQVLWLEDDRGFGAVGKRLLDAGMARAPSGRDLDVRLVTRLTDALAAMAEARFDVVITDLNLPDSNGLETLERVRGAAGDAAIVVLTGAGDDDAALLAAAEDAEFLEKDSMDEDSLARSVLSALERRAHA